MDTTSLQRFKDLLAQNDRIGIMVGKNPNVDEMAAALSLYLSLKSSNKSTVIASASQPIVELSSLVGIDEVKASLGSAGGDLVVSFPYQEGEIEKVSYTIENGQLNIVVKAGENGLTFAEQDVQFTRGGGLPTVLIVVGTAQLATLGEMFNQEAMKDVTIVNIDNKPENENFGDIVLVSPQFSSVSEQMANIILSNGLPLDVDTAQNLMLGISFATNNFQSPQTSYFAFEIVAELMRRGAVRVPVMPTQVQTPSFMQQPQQQPQQPPQQQQAQPRSQQSPRQQGSQRSQFNQGQRNRGQQQGHGGQQQGKFQQRSSQNQQNSQNNQGNQNNRQDEIRRALAEQARSMQPQPQQQSQQPQPAQPVQTPPQPMQQTQQAPQQQPQQPQPQNSAPAQDAPSDWLTPKVYKGSSNPS